MAMNRKARRAATSAKTKKAKVLGKMEAKGLASFVSAQQDVDIAETELSLTRAKLDALAAKEFKKHKTSVKLAIACFDCGTVYRRALQNVPNPCPKGCQD